VRQTKLGYFVATFEMALDQILNMLPSEILEPGKAIDAAESEEDLASKFSGLERVTGGDANDSAANYENHDGDDETISNDDSAVIRQSTQVRRLPSTNNSQGGDDSRMMD